ncbi:MAG: hypothetical protein PHT76_15130, partial [Anaerostipes sp.]|nr:hypothetical protein [Anaerostipes sp.]
NESKTIICIICRMLAWRGDFTHSLDGDSYNTFFVVCFFDNKKKAWRQKRCFFIFSWNDNWRNGR